MSPITSEWNCHKLIDQKLIYQFLFFIELLLLQDASYEAGFCPMKNIGLAIGTTFFAYLQKSTQASKQARWSEVSGDTTLGVRQVPTPKLLRVPDAIVISNEKFEA